MEYDGLLFGSGKRGDHDEHDDFVQGRGRYTSDIDVPGQLYAYFVRSPMAAARRAGLRCRQLHRRLPPRWPRAQQPPQRC